MTSTFTFVAGLAFWKAWKAGSRVESVHTNRVAFGSLAGFALELADGALDAGALAEGALVDGALAAGAVDDDPVDDDPADVDPAAADPPEDDPHAARASTAGSSSAGASRRRRYGRRGEWDMAQSLLIETVGNVLETGHWKLRA